MYKHLFGVSKRQLEEKDLEKSSAPPVTMSNGDVYEFLKTAKTRIKAGEIAKAWEQKGFKVLIFGNTLGNYEVYAKTYPKLKNKPT